MATQNMYYGGDDRARMAKGVGILARALKTTLGPKAHDVVLVGPDGTPTVTDDSTLIMQGFALEDALEDLGAQLVKEVASATGNAVGDGVATTAVLAREMVREGLRLIHAGVDGILLKRGIDRAVQALVGELIEAARPVTTSRDIAHVGTVAADGDASIGDSIAAAMDRVGKEGIILVEDGYALHDELDVVEGTRFDRGYLSSYFITDPERQTAVFEHPAILLCDRRIVEIRDLLPVLEASAQGGRPLVVIAEDVEGEALATLVINHLRGIMKTVAVKAPGFGDRRKAMLEDLAVLTGGRVATEETAPALENFTIADLGQALRVEVDRDSTTIVGAAGQAHTIEARVRQLVGQIDGADSDYDREKLRERVARLAGGIATIRAGASTGREIKRRKARLERALKTVGAALEEGVVAGGGVALLRARQAMGARLQGENADMDAGIRLVLKAIEAPVRDIVYNAGKDPGRVVHEILAATGDYGFDARNDVFGDMFEFGILAPVKLIRLALQGAASLSSLLLTSDGMVSDRMSLRHSVREYSAPPSLATGTYSNAGRSIEDTIGYYASTRAAGMSPGQSLPDAVSRQGVPDIRPYPAPRAGSDGGDAVGPLENADHGETGTGSWIGGTDSGIDKDGGGNIGGHGGNDAPPSTPPAPPPPGSGPRRFLNAQAPGLVGLNQAFGLVVQVSTRALATAPGRNSTLLGDFVGRLTVDVYSPDLVCETPALLLDVPDAGDSVPIRFAFIANKAGRHQIHVMAWNKSAQVAGLTLEVAVEVAQAEPKVNQVQADLDLREPESGEYTLDVAMEKETRRYRFQLRSDTLVTYPLMYSEPLLHEKQTTFDSLAAQLNGQARNLFQHQPADQARWLRGLGMLLCEQFIPDALKDALLAKRSKIRYLNILCDNDPMPWELLFILDPKTGDGQFLTESAIVSRWRYGERPPRVLRRAHPYFVLPGNAPTSAQGELARLMELLGGGIQIGSLSELNDLLEAGGFDLLHFAAHNVNLPGVSGGAYVPFGAQRWDMNFLGAVPRNKFGTAAPLVFMNACTSAGTTPLYTELSGWANRFLLCGCGAFIGALWEVRDTSARTFAEEVYGRLVDGATLGEAMKSGRKALRQNNQGDPTALAYTLYGNALATLQ